MLLLLVLLAVAAYVCIRLGAWQLDRAAIRGASEARAIEETRLAADPVPLDYVLGIGDTVTKDQKLVKVEVTGHWGEQVLVPGRVIAGEDAHLVLNEFRIDDGGEPDALLAVVRGWIPSDDVAAAGGAAGVPAPSGPATLVGHLSDPEKAAGGDFTAGEVGAISIGQLVNMWGGPAYAAYIVTTEPVGEGVGLVPPPAYAEGEGMNLQNLAYAAEWWIFGGFALFLWWRMVRDDAVHRREDAELAAVESETTAAEVE